MAAGEGGMRLDFATPLTQADIDELLRLLHSKGVGT